MAREKRKLHPEKSSKPMWPWLLGGILVLALLAAGLFYFVIKGDLLGDPGRLVKDLLGGPGRPVKDLLGGPGRPVKKEWHYNSQTLPNDAPSLELLASKGDANAQYKLALILIEGSRGFNNEANGWLLIAESRGHELAAKAFYSQLPAAYIGTQTARNEAVIKNAEKFRDSLLKNYPKADGS